MIAILLGLLATWLFISFVFYESGFKSRYGYSGLDEDRTKTNWNAIALFLNIRDGELKLPKRKTGIDKEIEEEEKEIAELEKHKEKMNKLAELKKRKTELFNDVHEVHEEELGEYWICPQCRREFKDLEGLNNHRAWEHRP